MKGALFFAGLLAHHHVFADTVNVKCTAINVNSCVVNDDVEGPYGSATASYENTTGGFRNLQIKTSQGGDWENEHVLKVMSYAAGVAEGILTCDDMRSFTYNVLASSFGRINADVNDDLKSFILAQDEWVRAQSARYVNGSAGKGPEGDYWSATGQVLATFDGILDGYNNFSTCGAQTPLTRLDFLLVNLDGDLFDLQTAFPDTVENTKNAPTVGAVGRTRGRGMASGAPGEVDELALRCSALIKLALDYEDVYFGHDTWDTYATAAPRIFKSITSSVERNSSVHAHVDSYSSSPGFVASIDDYYMIKTANDDVDDTRLVVIETSNGVYNTSAYEALSPETSPCWIRVMVANMLGTSGSTWSEVFGAYHSGTYNNQWLIVDLNQFQAGSKPTKDLLWVTEEAPGLMHAEDQTESLVNDLYWASYNVAYYDDVRAVLGETGSYDDAVRAQLFREMQGNVTSIGTMQYLMGWNNYENEPLTKGNPGNAIMARNDLRGFPEGGIDSKVSSASAYYGKDGSFRPMTTFARAGPTHDDQPAFCWKDQPQFLLTPHRGHPACFSYEWMAVSPS